VKVNVGFTLIELSGLVLVVVIGAAALMDGLGDPGRALEIKEGEALLPAVMAGAGLAFYAMIGFEDSVNVAEEAREPQRNYPRALFGGLLIAGLVYLAVSVVASMAVPTDKLAASHGPLLEVVQLGPLAVNTKLFAAIALFAVANSALINMIMASRLLYGMSAQGIVPGVFSKVLRHRRTPWVAIAFTTLLAMILVSTGDLSTLADMTVLRLLTVFALVNVSVLVLRRRRRRARALPRADPPAGDRRRDLDHRHVHQGRRRLPARRRAAPRGRGLLAPEPRGAARARAVLDRGGRERGAPAGALTRPPPARRPRPRPVARGSGGGAVAVDDRDARPQAGELEAWPAREERVGRVAAAAVVVEDDEAAGGEVRGDPLQAGRDRVVPIAVDVGERDRAPRVQHVLEQPLVEEDAVADGHPERREPARDVLAEVVA
jgi:hypothetical protein